MRWPDISSPTTARKVWPSEADATGSKERMLLNWETHTSFIIQLTELHEYTWLSTNSNVLSQLSRLLTLKKKERI